MLKKYFTIIINVDTVVMLNIVCKTVIIFPSRIIWWIHGSKEQHLYEKQIFCSINVSTITFNQFNASSLNKRINVWTQTFEMVLYNLNNQLLQSLISVYVCYSINRTPDPCWPVQTKIAYTPHDAKQMLPSHVWGNGLNVYSTQLQWK